MIDDKQEKNEKPSDLDEAALDAASGALPMHGEPDGRRPKRSGGTQTEDDLYVG